MKKLLLLIPILVLTLIAYFSYQIITKTQEINEIESKRSTLPHFQFEHLQEGTYSLEQIDTTKATVIIAFAPDCSFCQYEAKAIAAHREDLSKANVLMVSGVSKEEVQSFGEEYNLIDKEGIHLLVDSERQFYEYFGTTVVPSILIYDKHQNLVKHYKGETKIEAVLKYI